MALGKGDFRSIKDYLEFRPLRARHDYLRIKSLKSKEKKNPFCFIGLSAAVRDTQIAGGHSPASLGLEVAVLDADMPVATAKIFLEKGSRASGLDVQGTRL